MDMKFPDYNILTLYLVKETQVHKKTLCANKGLKGIQNHIC